MQYQKLPGRLLFFPWRLFPRHGSIAADTDFYPFGTRMFVPGYGWGEARPPITLMLLSHYISELLVAGNFSWLIYSSEDNPDFLRVGFLWKQVEDRGKAIKGPKRIDLYHRSHREALQWGRRKLQVFFSHL